MTAPTMLNARDVAATLGLPYWKAVELLTRGALPGAQKAEGEWRVTLAEVERFRARHLAAVEARVEDLAASGRAASYVREWWTGQMRVAQREAAAAAEQFAALYRSLARDAKRGTADPAKAEAFGQQSDVLISALLRFQAVNDLYPKLSELKQSVDRQAWAVARELAHA